jgi:hypothetical protein
MLPDPLPLQHASGDISFSTQSVSGAKSIRVAAAAGLSSDEIQQTLTVSHDLNAKTGRKRSVLRIDVDYNNSSAGDGSVVERASAYLVLDRIVPSGIDVSQAHTRRAIAEILSFFTTDPTAAASGNINYAITTTNGEKLIAGEP